MEENPKPTRRRWFQCSLRTFLVVITLVGFGGAWLGMQLQQKRRHVAVVNEILKSGGTVLFLDAEEVPAWKEWLFGSYAVTPVYLHLVGTDVTDALLSQVQGMNLVVVDLRGSEVTDAGMTHLKELPRVTKLFLSNTHITDVGLAPLEGLTSLTWLDLDKTQVTDVGLVRLKGLTSLTWLDLDNTQVTDAGLLHLEGLSSLKMFFLGNTQVTDAGLTHLKGLTSLEHLDLFSTQVTDAGVDRLRKAIPKCRIFR